MSNLQHTPAPWAIRDDDEDGVVSIVGTSQIVLAMVRTATVEPGDENARLIAAAPDLLEALEEITADYADRFDMESPSTNPGIKYVIGQARAAIAKATGSAA